MAFNITDIYYTGNTIDVTTQDNYPLSVAISDDGTELYVAGNDNDSVYQYTMTTPFKLSTASYTRTKSISAQVDGPAGLEFKPDGTKLYIFAISGTRGIYQYSMSTPWDISTLSYDSKTYAIPDSFRERVIFDPTGTKVYYVGVQWLYQLSLSTAWDISSASADTSLDISSDPSGSGSILDIMISSDGTKLYMGRYTDNKIYQYTMSTAWNVSTATYDSVSQSIHANITNSSGLALSSSNTFFYINSLGEDVIYEYATGNFIVPTTKVTIAFSDTGIYKGSLAPTTKSSIYITQTFIADPINLISKASISLTAIKGKLANLSISGKSSISLVADSVLKTTTLNPTVLPTFTMALPTGLKNTSISPTTKSSISLNTRLTTGDSISPTTKSGITLLGTRIAEYNINVRTKATTSFDSTLTHVATAAFTTKSEISLIKSLTLRAIYGIITTISTTLNGRTLTNSSITSISKASCSVTGSLFKDTSLSSTSKSSASFTSDLTLTTSLSSISKVSSVFEDSYTGITTLTVASKTSTTLTGTWRDSTSAALYARTKVSFSAIPSYATYLEDNNRDYLIKYSNEDTLIRKS